MLDLLIEILGQFFIDWIYDSLKHIGAYIKSIFKNKPYKEILKEDWNTRLGILTLSFILWIIVLLIDKL